MEDNSKRRREERLDYQWPVWFSTDFTQTMSQGLMVDVASGGIAFICEAGSENITEGQQLTIRFSIPRFEGDDPTATVSVTRTGNVLRVEQLARQSCRVAIEFDVPLAVRPAEVSSLKACCAENPAQ